MTSGSFPACWMSEALVICAGKRTQPGPPPVVSGKTTIFKKTGVTQEAGQNCKESIRGCGAGCSESGCCCRFVALSVYIYEFLHSMSRKKCTVLIFLRHFVILLCHSIHFVREGRSPKSDTPSAGAGTKKSPAVRAGLERAEHSGLHRREGRTVEQGHQAVRRYPEPEHAQQRQQQRRQQRRVRLLRR